MLDTKSYICLCTSSRRFYVYHGLAEPSFLFVGVYSGLLFVKHTYLLTCCGNTYLVSLM